MRDMRELVKRLASEGITILLSSHVLAEVEELCNRVAIIRKGRIIYEGRLDELIESAGGGYILRTSEPERARTLLLAHGIDGAVLDQGEVRFQAEPAAVEAVTHRARPGRHRHLRARAARRDARGALPRHDRARGGGVIRVYRWEVLKLLAQKRTYLGLGAAMLVPLIFVTVLILKTGGPNDIPLGRYIRQTGLATPFVVLFFMSIWAFPLITALVAGDIVASESHNGTLKTILTRSRNRGEIFAAKILATFTYTAVVVFAMGGGRVRRRRASSGGSTTSRRSRARRSARGTGSACSPRASRSTRGRWRGSPHSGSSSRP